jgi:hypothetical protein
MYGNQYILWHFEVKGGIIAQLGFRWMALSMLSQIGDSSTLCLLNMLCISDDFGTM